MILVNSVLKYVDVDNGERIRIIETDEENAYVVNIDSASSMPKIQKLQQLEEEIDAEKLILVKDPFSKILEDKELTEVQIKKRELDWKLIEKYWKDNKNELLQKSYRNKAFKKISDESGISLSTVKKLFSRFWQRGMNKNALLPDYINSGARGKERKLSDNKVGRPKKTDYYGESNTGINITLDVKKHFELAINKYYRNKKKASLAETYTLLLRDFYSDTYTEDGEVKYRVWDESRIPSYQQFYYWFRKTKNIQKDIIFRESEKEFNLKHSGARI